MLNADAPMTTNAIATAAGIPLLTVRPRVTELCQAGLAEFVGRDGHHGRYRAIPLRLARRIHVIAHTDRQPELPLT